MSTQFKTWKSYVMAKHFRLELNIGSEEPLPKIVKDRRAEEGDLIAEPDPRVKYPPTAEEQMKIE